MSCMPFVTLLLSVINLLSDSKTKIPFIKFQKGKQEEGQTNPFLLNLFFDAPHNEIYLHTQVKFLSI